MSRSAGAVQPIPTTLAADTAMHESIAQSLASRHAQLMGCELVPGSMTYRLVEPVAGADGEPIEFHLDDGTPIPTLPALVVEFEVEP